LSKPPYFDPAFLTKTDAARGNRPVWRAQPSRAASRTPGDHTAAGRFCQNRTSVPAGPYIDLSGPYINPSKPYIIASVRQQALDSQESLAT
jgi:hypothetical protein